MEEVDAEASELTMEARKESWRTKKGFDWDKAGMRMSWIREEGCEGALTETVGQLHPIPKVERLIERGGGPSSFCRGRNKPTRRGYHLSLWRG